mmetsp:Transcript_5325/g.15620  ORF Transcript_5325/g.15620 Transcript_5325/m.15620 type:complete len:204 (+) Transcript_5325:1349-1960(+)
MFTPPLPTTAHVLPRLVKSISGIHPSASKFSAKSFPNAFSAKGSVCTMSCGALAAFQSPFFGTCIPSIRSFKSVMSLNANFSALISSAAALDFSVGAQNACAATRFSSPFACSSSSSSWCSSSISAAFTITPSSPSSLSSSLSFSSSLSSSSSSSPLPPLFDCTKTSTRLGTMKSSNAFKCASFVQGPTCGLTGTNECAWCCS